MRTKYKGQCDRVRRQSAMDEQRWQDMMAAAERVSMSAFLRSVDISPLLDEDETAREWVRNARRSDPDTDFYQSWWGDRPCWFIQSAGFEFIFVEE
jgi:hypothetical protein